VPSLNTKSAASLVIAIVLGVCGTAEATNGLKLTAYGPRAAGRGGVDYAFADDAIGPVNNPAGMAFTYGNRFDNNWVAVNTTVRWTNQYNETGRSRNHIFFAVPAFSFGVVYDGNKDWEIAPLFDLGRWGLFDDAEEGGEDTGDAEPGTGDSGDDLANELDTAAEYDDGDIYGSAFKWGIGVFPVTGGKIQLRNLKIRVPSDPVNASDGYAYTPNIDWETDILTLAVTPSVAYRFSQHFSAGLNVQLIYSRFELDGGIAQPVSNLQEPFRSISPALSRGPQTLSKADLDDAFTFGFSWRMGVMFNSKYVSVGLIYQDRSYMQDYLGKATVDAKDEINRLTTGNPALLSVLDPGINAAEGFRSVYDLRIPGFASPRMVGLGFAIRPHRRFSVGIDYTYIHWSEVMRNFRSRLTNGNNTNLDILTGSTINVKVPLRFDNQHVIALGVTGLVAEGDDLVEGVPSYQFVLRAGYNYGKNPTPADTTLPQQPTISEHHVSAGFTFHWGPLIEFNVGWEWALPTTLNTPGTHIADYTLSDSKQEVELMFLHWGMGVNF
jgi:long-subunit fatty acid transport protein